MVVRTVPEWRRVPPPRDPRGKTLERGVGRPPQRSRDLDGLYVLMYISVLMRLVNKGQLIS